MHVDACSIMLGVLLMQLGEGDLDHPIAYASRKMSFVERNYTTTEREGLAIVDALHKFRHYFFSGNLRCSPIILLCNTWSISLCWGGRSVDGCYSSRSLILK